MATLGTGTMLGDRYEIVRAIKSGGMGVVYEARDRRLADSPCAIKQLLDHDADDDSVMLLRRKFDEEMQFLASLSHPGIPRLRDFFSDGQRQFLVMDLVEGSSLDDELDAAVAAGRAMPAEQVVDDAIELLDILVYLHGRKPPVVHRDIKPANVIRERDGRLKLLDFGIARLHEGRATTHTQLGTLCYAPLEQIQGHAEPRSDLYALAATMHHLISGVESPALALPPLQRVAPAVDADLAAIVNRAVAAAPVDRYDDAVAMRAALVEWRNRHQPASTTAQLPQDASGTMPLSRSSPHTLLSAARETVPVPSPEEDARRIPVAFLVVGLAVVVVLASWLLAPRTAPPPAASSPSPVPVVAATVERGNPIVLSGTPPVMPTASAPVGGSPRVGYASPPQARARATAAPSRPSASPAARASKPAPPVPRPAPVLLPAATPPPAPPPPAVAVEPTPLPTSYTENPPPIAPAPPEQRPEGPPDRPGAGPQGGPGQRPGHLDYEPALPVGWQAVVVRASDMPPRKDFTITSPSMAQARIHLTVWMMPSSMFATAINGFLTDLQREQWRIGPPQTSGGVQAFSLERAGAVGLFEVRAEAVVGEHIRLFGATLQASNASELGQLRRVADAALGR